MTLTILCVSKLEPHSLPFLATMRGLAARGVGEFVLVADGAEAESKARSFFHDVRIERVDSAGYLESVHDQAVDYCQTPYVLRLDDDESCSVSMMDWLSERDYLECDHWKFCRAHMWDPRCRMDTPQLWPDHQTRLSVREKMKGRQSIHAGSPFGGGQLAPCSIEHWKFMVKTQEQRQEIARRYDAIMAGAGSNGMLAFQLPELAYGEIPLVPWSDGRVG